jgi:AcrR family transcriptional regulator
MSQNAPSTDLRVRRTHKALRDVMLELIVAKGFNAISVGELTQRAMVNRATFYRHYRDKDDLLERIIAEMFDELTRSVGASDPPDAHPVSLSDVLGAWLRVFEHVAAHAALYQAMMGPKGSPAFAAQVRGYVETLLRQRVQVGGSGDRASGIPDDVSIAFATNAFLGTVAWWLESGMPYSPQQMAGWLGGMFVLGPFQAAGWEMFLHTGRS